MDRESVHLLLAFLMIGTKCRSRRLKKSNDLTCAGGTYDIRFCPMILGVLIDDPMILLPEMAMPLKLKEVLVYFWVVHCLEIVRPGLERDSDAVCLSLGQGRF